MKENNPLIESIDELIKRSSEAQKKFLPGSNHHMLLKNRIYALNIARDLIQNEVGERKPIYKEELDSFNNFLKNYSPHTSAENPFA